MDQTDTSSNKVQLKIELQTLVELIKKKQIKIADFQCLDKASKQSLWHFLLNYGLTGES